MQYHGHIYYQPKQAQAIEILAKQLAEQTFIKLQPLSNQLRGPHPLPMLELHFSVDVLDSLIKLLQRDAAGFSVLLHPVLVDELKAHTEQAIWLGKPVDLDLTVLSEK